MFEIKITVETEQQKFKIMEVLEDAEEECLLDFSFNVEVRDTEELQPHERKS